MMPPWMGGPGGGPGMGPPGMGGPGNWEPGMGPPDMNGPEMGPQDMGPLGMAGPDIQVSSVRPSNRSRDYGDPWAESPEIKQKLVVLAAELSDDTGDPWAESPKSGAQVARTSGTREVRSTEQSTRRGAENRDRATPGRQSGNRQGGGRGMPGGNLLSRSGAQDFFNAVKSNVALGDVIYMEDGAGANLIVGATGRWTTGGILRDVRSDQTPVQPDKCDFSIVLSGGMGMQGPGGPMGSRNPPSSFEKVFENDYGTLYRNPSKVEHTREPHKAEVSLPLLLLIALIGLTLILCDFLLPRLPWTRLAAGSVGTLVAAVCLIPLANTAVSELRNPPAVPPLNADGPPGFGGPGFGGPGFN